MPCRVTNHNVCTPDEVIPVNSLILVMLISPLHVKDACHCSCNTTATVCGTRISPQNEDYKMHIQFVDFNGNISSVWLVCQVF